MLLEKLPLELVQHIVYLVVSGNGSDGNLKALTALLKVNKTLENEVAELCLRNVQDTRHGVSWWPRVPYLVRLRMTSEIIASEPAPGEKRTIATYMHAVAYYLQQYALLHDPGETGRLSHTEWLYEIASILALRGADCRCGKPAFMHSRCHDLSSVPDTAFHVVLLRQHTKLESGMVLEDGKGIDTECPYLKVSMKDPFFARKNALEWACARGLENSVVHLVAVAEELGRNAEMYLPTAAAVCAMHTTLSMGTLLETLLDKLDRALLSSRLHHDEARLQYCNRMIRRKVWLCKVFTSSAQHRCLDGMFVLRKHYPYCESESLSKAVWPKRLHWEPIKLFMQNERPYCTFGRWEEDKNCKHWIRCRKDWCGNQFSKANPWCDICTCHHGEQDLCPKCGKHHPPNRHLYEWDGWPRSYNITRDGRLVIPSM
jgi:hypothetical protein